ncbi:DNA translocase FtsK [Desulfosporosinus shakirovi]|uniref:DNA translocase FtsK n=1 Tax=Desulfosporosinus shakirovi TaxID=2885154 RepID=UPI001E423595|nr:DNA translocase FtsK [Desulfosporosinus sp. SRJS8]MCB8818623.1 hypothetical protein [Desulfosporosinus sp. SRJS8]
MTTFTIEQMIKIAILTFILLDFIKESSKQGRINITEFPVYLFLLFGRILDTLTAAFVGLFTLNGTPFIVIKGSLGRFIENLNRTTDSTHNRELESYWFKWGKQRKAILSQTLERSGAHIMVEKNKLPGYRALKLNPSQPVPLVQTIDFNVRYSATDNEVHFVPVYYFGVDPSLRSAIRQRVEDGTLSVAFGVPANHVFFCERNGQEVITVKVGSNERTLPPQAQTGKKLVAVQSLKPVEPLDLNPLGEGLPFLSIFQNPKPKKAQKDDMAKLIIDAFNRLNLGVDSSGQSKFRYQESIFGPTITQVIFKTPSGVKITSLAREGENVAAELGIAGSIRITAVSGMPGCVGVEVPNRQRGLVTIQEMVASPEFRESKAAIPICIGMTLHGKPLIADLTKLPHLLIAGATNQGKSVGLNAMIVSLLVVSKPDRLKLIMVDPKAVELTVYEDLPHLMAPIATEAKDARPLLDLMVNEMENRYSLFRSKKARNIVEYNSKVKAEERFPYIVGIIDEYADLMMGAKSEGKDLEIAVVRLGQKARAAGIHLILATQRPTANVVTGLIKANMPGRLAYKVSSLIDSQVILDRPGAESLTGMGDLLLLGPTDPEPIRAQGPLVTDEEIERVVAFWSKNRVKAKTIENPGESLKDRQLFTQQSSKNNQEPSKRVINFPEKLDSDKETMVGIPDVTIIPEIYIVEGKRGNMVNLGIPSKPKTLNMSNDAWAILYGYSVRIVVRDQAPRRDYLKTLLNVGTDVAQSLMQFFEAGKIISPYKGPKAPRQIFVSIEQVERIFPESRFSMHNYTDSINDK